MKLAVFAIGIVVGFVIADNTSAQQRSKARTVAQRVRSGRAASVAGNVGSGLGDIADAATDRVNGVVDHAASNVAGLVADPTV